MILEGIIYVLCGVIVVEVTSVFDVMYNGFIDQIIVGFDLDVSVKNLLSLRILLHIFFGSYLYLLFLVIKFFYKEEFDGDLGIFKYCDTGG